MAVQLLYSVTPCSAVRVWCTALTRARDSSRAGPGCGRMRQRPWPVGTIHLPMVREKCLSGREVMVWLGVACMVRLSRSGLTAACADGSDKSPSTRQATRRHLVRRGMVERNGSLGVLGILQLEFCYYPVDFRLPRDGRSHRCISPFPRLPLCAFPKFAPFCRCSPPKLFSSSWMLYVGQLNMST